ncbi:hypothetical protein EVAR_32431_1 [Eumeta japonica]|uniref:Uncharacterized protein n=1 Tax=Eumeta variegata TaxID=151549 RepID=A0A4C1VMX0_EUMVA|nr:hypothetical protein EVAR_32431_1 [Eumeta japonica]
MDSCYCCTVHCYTKFTSGGWSTTATDAPIPLQFIDGAFASTDELYILHSRRMATYFTHFTYERHIRSLTPLLKDHPQENTHIHIHQGIRSVKNKLQMRSQPPHVTHSLARGNTSKGDKGPSTSSHRLPHLSIVLINSMVKITKQILADT